MQLVRANHRVLDALPYVQMLQVVTQATSVCYGTQIKESIEGMERYITARIKAGHESILEHVGFSVRFTVDRGLTHQLVRHRVGCAFTQSSTRFQDYRNEITVVMPSFVAKHVPDGSYWYIYTADVGNKKPVPVLRSKHGLDVQINRLIEAWLIPLFQAEIGYTALIGKDVPPELARGVLPTALAATLVMTANMREWRHIFRLRALGTAGRPHPQMVELMRPLLVEAKDRWPVFFADLVMS